MKIGKFFPSPGTIYVKIVNPIEPEVFSKMDHDQLRVYTE